MRSGDPKEKGKVKGKKNFAPEISLSICFLRLCNVCAIMHYLYISGASIY